MSRWELEDAPELIPVATEHFDKILDEVAEILYDLFCKSEGQWLDQIQQNSKTGGKNRARSRLRESAQQPQRRSVS